MKLTVLIVEDEIVTREAVSNTFRKRGYEVLGCSQGKEAWELLWEVPGVSLVITDMMMPDMDGRELVHLMRAHEDFEKIPVLILSGVVEESAIADLLQLGPTRFLSKPASPTALLGIAEELVLTTVH